LSFPEKSYTPLFIQVNASEIVVVTANGGIRVAVPIDGRADPGVAWRRLCEGRFRLRQTRSPALDRRQRCRPCWWSPSCFSGTSLLRRALAPTWRRPSLPRPTQRRLRFPWATKCASVRTSTGALRRPVRPDVGWRPLLKGRRGGASPKSRDRRGLRSQHFPRHASRPSELSHSLETWRLSD